MCMSHLVHELSGRTNTMASTMTYSTLCDASASRKRKNMYEAELEMNLTNGFLANCRRERSVEKSVYHTCAT